MRKMLKKLYDKLIIINIKVQNRLENKKTQKK